MAENEELNFDFDPDNIPDTNTFWNGLDAYWNANRQFPQGTDQKLSKKADLIDGKIPSSQLPSYVDDVLEFNSLESLPNPGEQGKIYITTNNNFQYRWSGSEYIQMNSYESLMNLNGDQFITGKKSFFTSGGSGYNNHNLRLYSDDGSNPGMTFYKGGTDVAVMYFDGTGNFRFRNSDNTISRFVFAQGFKKDGSNGSRILLGDGTDRPVTDFATVTGADAKYITYTGATTNVNLNTKNIANAGSIDATVFRNTNSSVLVKSFSLHNSTTVTSLGIKLTNPGTSIMMGSFTVTVFGYVGQTISFRVSMYKYSSNWFAPTITWLHGDSSKVSNIAFYKEDNANLHLKVNFTTNFGAYNKTVITDVLANFNSEALHNPDTYTISVNPDNSTHTLVQTTSNSGFVRDNVGDVPKASISLGTSDLNTITTAGFYNQSADANATLARNYPITLAGSLSVYRTVGNGFVQEYTTYNSRITYKRSYTGASWTTWTQLIDSVNGGTISADLTVSKTAGGNINIGTGATAGTTASPKYMNLNFLGYSNALKAKISSLDVGGNSVLSPLIFYTYASTGLQESMRIEGGGSVKIQNLSGTGNRIVIASVDGTLSTQDIPNISNYLPLTGGTLSGNLIVNANITTTIDNSMIRVGNNGDIGLVKKGGAGGFIGVGPLGFSVKASTNNYSVSDTFSEIFKVNTAGYASANAFVKLGGTSSQFLKADGSVDSNSYSLTNHTHSFSSLTSKPTTLSGYGITDAIPTSHPTNGVNTAQINNWNSAFGWGNHAAAGYATSDFVDESIAQITAEFINPDYPISASCKINTVIITEEFTKEYLELEAELIPERQITVTNLAPFEINVKREDHSIDTIRTGETTEYYITAEKRLVKKGTYKGAVFLS